MPLPKFERSHWIYTMYRCTPSRRAALAWPAIFVAAAVMAAFPVRAQMQRPFTAAALRGELVVTQPPEILLNGKPNRLTAGARIRNENNLIEMSGGLINRKLTVNYVLDAEGRVSEAWILTAAERAKRPWPVTPAQAAQWVFDAQAQTWSRP